MNAAPGGRPNIVLIVVDDLGWRDLSCYGSSFYETRALDALARRGVLFRQACAAAPVSSPSRASLMTGKYPARVGITQYIGGQSVGALADFPYFHGLPENEYSLARALRDGGYQTWHVGKWQVDLAGREPAEVGRLAALLDAWAADVLAAVPQANPRRRFVD